MDDTPILESVYKIWDYAKHNALCDLIQYKGFFFCCFRESDAHVYGTNGVIRILKSNDGETWVSSALIAEDGVDLRDPKLSITPNGQLMLLLGGSIYHEKKYLTRQPRVTFSDNGHNWGTLTPILQEREWLWRVTWHQDIAYGASYSAVDESKPKGEWKIKLFSSQNGIDYSLITTWIVPGKPNESTIRFDEQNRMIALVRREQRLSNQDWIGISAYPYHSWNWKQARCHLGGPNFLIFPEGKMWAAGRLIEINPYGYFGRTALCEMTLEDLIPALFVPSGGDDTSYPGLVYDKGVMWMAYYSSHETKTAIYMAKIKFLDSKSRPSGVEPETFGSGGQRSIH